MEAKMSPMTLRICKFSTKPPQNISANHYYSFKAKCNLDIGLLFLFV